MTDKPIVRSEGADTGPAYGAARLAAFGDGALDRVDLALQKPTTDRFEPADMASMTERLMRFRALYASVSAVE